ncbi:hypothetical protein JSY36_15465 [Bacillus sp. H-16]|uniref:hypothetical protein n=1 Tax=Alteribacter salitolerans TaxID=2912333 RepID=UPI001965CA62|nr:hypothetical protein [Alteribacter salitolerans]MBM7097131.1 hypothetical protein [Alteribacter salitolerans]
MKLKYCGSDERIHQEPASSCIDTESCVALLAEEKAGVLISRLAGTAIQSEEHVVFSFFFCTLKEVRRATIHTKQRFIFDKI